MSRLFGLFVVLLIAKGFGILRPAKRPTYSSDNDRKNHVAFAIKMRQEHGPDFWTDEVDGVSYLNGVSFAYKGNLWNKRGLSCYANSQYLLL